MEFLRKLFIDERIVRQVQRTYDPTIELLSWQVKQDDPEQRRHFLSNTCKLVLTCKRGADVRVLSFFVKCPHDMAQYERYQVGPVAEKEYLMYKTVLPAVRALSSMELPAPVSYYVHDDDGSIIMEDFERSGYRTRAAAVQPLDVEQATCALEALATYHAHSAKLHEISPRLLDGVRGMEFLRSDGAAAEGKATLLGRRFAKLVARVEPQLATQQADGLRRFAERFYRMAVAEAASQADAFNVLNHGDYWTSNMMFRYDSEGRVDGVKFFDFQFSHWSSPANDIVLFLMMSVEYDTFERHLERLLDAYVRALTRTLTALEWRGGTPYTAQRLRDDIRGKCNFWILMLIWWGPIFFSTRDEFKGDTLAEYLVDGKNFQARLNNWLPFFVRLWLEAHGGTFDRC